MNCPYYGYHYAQTLHVLVEQHGNQCPFIVTGYAPCIMEIRGQTPDWDACIRNDGMPVTVAIMNAPKVSL